MSSPVRFSTERSGQIERIGLDRPKGNLLDLEMLAAIGERFEQGAADPGPRGPRRRVLGAVHYGEFGIPEPVAVLDTILVDPLHARRGIASAMLEELASNLSRLGVDRIRTEVPWNDPLSRFLRTHGVRACARARPGALARPGNAAARSKGDGQ
jgi:GNAT superfamily N-acetyltransferase